MRQKIYKAKAYQRQSTNQTINPLPKGALHSLSAVCQKTLMKEKLFFYCIL